MNSFKLIIPRTVPSEKVVCGYTTRSGGVSSPPFDSLNLGFHTPDDHARVAENHRIVYRYAGADENEVAFMGQVHGSAVKIVDSGGVYPGTDGLITARRGLLLGVKVADCIPLLLYDPGHEVIGAIHCGWRPIVDGIARKAVALMSGHYKTDPAQIVAVMGPSAGPCCYEVGPDVACRLRPESVTDRGGSLFADLRAELVSHLTDAGVAEHHIEIFNDCTICRDSLYYSFRRSGDQSGRMLGFIMLKGNVL
ncbi:peptidoglycan editing factor PgeF [bacterium]|nr:peptidoglycan editing factor PgeF [bacterium]